MSENLTKKYRTPTINMKVDNIKDKKAYGMSMDIGYSSVKIFAPNKIACFPAYARQVSGEQISLTYGTSENHILYKESDDIIWSVGADAQNMMSVSETEDSVATLYGRNRYFSSMFRVISNVGLALGLKENPFGRYLPYMPLYLQTGLPSKYMSDKADLIEALSGHHDFYVKFGSKPWEHYTFDLAADNIFVMPQPMGTLQSICTTKAGGKIPESKNYFNSNLLIIDPGFGTFDTFEIRHGYPSENNETYANLGMKAVLQATSNEIYKKYQQKILVPAMQQYLESGTIKVSSRQQGERRIKTSLVDFSDILDRCNKEICYKALDKLMTVYNNLEEIDYLVITGGTGAAWYNLIVDYFKDMETLTVIPGNQNDTNLDFIFANARGYYFNLIDRLKLANKQKL